MSFTLPATTPTPTTNNNHNNGNSPTLLSGSARTKIVLRNLPPNLDASDFSTKIIDPIRTHLTYYRYVQGRQPAPHSSDIVRPTRVYLGFKDSSRLFEFVESVKSTEFKDETGFRSFCLPEFAVYQCIPPPGAACTLPRFRDKYENTIGQNSTYQAFLKDFERSIEAVPIPLEKQLESLMVKERELHPWKFNKTLVKQTPLLEHLRKKVAEKDSTRRSSSLTKSSAGATFAGKRGEKRSKRKGSEKPGAKEKGSKNKKEKPSRQEKASKGNAKAAKTKPAKSGNGAGEDAAKQHIATSSKEIVQPTSVASKLALQESRDALSSPVRIMNRPSGSVVPPSSASRLAQNPASVRQHALSTSNTLELKPTIYSTSSKTLTTGGNAEQSNNGSIGKGEKTRLGSGEVVKKGSAILPSQADESPSPSVVIYRTGSSAAKGPLDKESKGQSRKTKLVKARPNE